MPSNNPNFPETTNNGQQKPWVRLAMYFRPPLRISMRANVSVTETNGKKYPDLKCYVDISIVERGVQVQNRPTILLGTDDWYRWMIVIGELLSKTRSIYVDGHIADTVTDQDYLITNYRGEVLQMVPLIAKIKDETIPAVRIIINNPAHFVDLPLIELKSMYNVINKIDLFTASLAVCNLGENL